MLLSDALTFEVDYNDRDKDGRLMASMRFASSARFPDPGETVWTGDDEGNGCWGTVAAVDGLIVYIDLARETWSRRPNLVTAFPEPADTVRGEDIQTWTSDTTKLAEPELV
jgi:hypothetical protein